MKQNNKEIEKEIIEDSILLGTIQKARFSKVKPIIYEKEDFEDFLKDYKLDIKKAINKGFQSGLQSKEKEMLDKFEKMIENNKWEKIECNVSPNATKIRAEGYKQGWNEALEELKSKLKELK